MKNKLLALMLTSAFISATAVFAADNDIPEFSESVGSRDAASQPLRNADAVEGADDEVHADASGQSRSSEINFMGADNSDEIDTLNQQVINLTDELDASKVNVLKLQTSLAASEQEIDQLTDKLTQALSEKDALAIENSSLAEQLAKMTEKYKTMKSDFKAFVESKKAPVKAAKASSAVDVEVESKSTSVRKTAATKPAEEIGALDAETTSAEVNETPAPKKEAAGKSRQTTGRSKQATATVVIAGFTQDQLDAGIERARAINTRRADALIQAITEGNEANVTRYMS